MGRIILAEDDDIVADMVIDTMIGAGHGIGRLPDGESALAAIRRRPPDLAILDCSMPGMSGIMVLRTIRRDPRLSGLPVLMLTARSSSADEEIARFEGANGYITKPFDPARLAQQASDLINGRQAFC
ncbi:MAG: response regulator [Sphingomonas bacterium]|nr:response regulator [Sphingomonas bacterium]